MSRVRQLLESAKSAGWSRRRFLKTGAAAALALALPAPVGCGSGGRGKRSRHTLHVDLSHVAPQLGDRPFFLQAGGELYRLQPHDGESRADAREDEPLLQGVADETLTHYAPDVALPDDALQLVHVTAGDPTRDPDHRLLLTALHVPGWARADHALYRAEKEGLDAADLPDTEDHGQDYLCYVDAAVAFVFHHPELCNLDPALATILLWHIDPVDPAQRCSRYAPHRQEILDLAAAMAAAGPDGFCVKDPLVASDGSPVFWATGVDGERHLVVVRDGVPYRTMAFDGDGNPLALEERDPSDRMPAFTYRPTDAILDRARAAVHAALNSAKDDPDLEGIAWTAVEGAPPVVHDTPPAPPNLGDAGGDMTVRLNHEGGHDGLSFRLPTKTLAAAEGDRFVTLEVKNSYMRYVGVFVRWLLADGTPDPQAAHYYGSRSAFGRPAWHAEVDRVVNGGFTVGGHDVGYDPPTFFLGILPAVPAFAGVPMPPDTYRFSIPLPPTSSKAEVIFASFGTGQARWATLPGATLTGIVNLGIPGYFLATGLYEGPAGKALLNSVVKNPAILEALVMVGLGLVATGALGDAGTGLDTSYTRWAKSLGSVLVSPGCSALRYAIVTAATEAAGERSIPFAGWALYLAGTAETMADLAQTIAEIASSDAVYRNPVDLTWTPQLRILPDPENIRGGFPESATRYTVTVQLENADFHKWESVELTSTAVPYLDLSFPEIPAGGRANWVVNFYAGEGDILVGTASKRLVNRPVAPGDTTVPDDEKDFTLQITELALPLTPETIYRQKDKIGVVSGTHRWLAAVDGSGHEVPPPVPTATKASLDCADTGPGMCAALGLTLSQHAKAAAYVWLSGGTEPACGGASGGGQLRSVQHLSLTGNAIGGPESFLRRSSCRWAYPGVAVAYDLHGPAHGHHAFVEPVRIDGTTRYLVRRIALDGSLAFGGGQAVACLSGPPDAVAIHPQGMLLAVSRLRGKLEIADLTADPVPDAQAPAARLAAGIGSRKGLLNGPVALAVRTDGVVLVLESGNRRVSAFDVGGAVLAPFASGTSFPLVSDPEPVVPLDLAVEGAGYVYVLSHVGSGATAADYRLDLYRPDGTWLARTTGMAAARLAVDAFRNVFTLNYETVLGPAGTEPTLGLWVPA